METIKLVLACIGILFILYSLSGCAENLDYLLPTECCHGPEVPRGRCPTAAVPDCDGTECHHEVNCGGTVEAPGT